MKQRLADLYILNTCPRCRGRMKPSLFPYNDSYGFDIWLHPAKECGECRILYKRTSPMWQYRLAEAMEDAPIPVRIAIFLLLVFIVLCTVGLLDTWKVSGRMEG